MIISIANQKGGVGKTTTALNLGSGLNREGSEVLLIDLDSQMDLSISLGLPEVEYTIDYVMKGKDIRKAIMKLEGEIHIIPASKDLKSTQITLNKTDVLSKALTNIKKEYDFIIIDTNPGMSILTINALIASDMIIIPIQAEYLALRGLKDFTETIEQLNEVYDIKPKIRVLITHFDTRKKLHVDAVEMVKQHFKKELFKTMIRTNVALAEAPGFNKDIFRYDQNSHGAIDYSLLTKEIIKEVK